LLLGILSDIHGNLPALEEALAVGASVGISDWICLGDVIDGGRWNNDCARLIQSRGIALVRGNHDEVYREGITEDVVNYLDAAPEEMIWYGCLCTHISPRLKRKRKISDRYEAYNVFDESNHPLIMVGHSHITAAWSLGAKPGEAREWKLALDVDHHLPVGDRYILSVGSLGYSRDTDPALRFGIWDDQRRIVRVQRIAAASVLDVGA